MPKQYKLSGLRSYINRGILISSTPSLLKEEIKFIKQIATNAVYRPSIIKKLYQQCLKKINKIENAQLIKKRFTTAIPFNHYTSSEIKNEVSKLGINFPIKLNCNIFQQIRKNWNS